MTQHDGHENIQVENYYALGMPLFPRTIIYFVFINIFMNHGRYILHSIHFYWCRYLREWLQEYLLFPNLSMLYLHKNNIQDFVDSYKLRKLNKLRTLTLHKNPMCELPCYRSTVISFLPNLRKLDHVVVVRSEREQDRKSLDKNVRERLTNAYPEDFRCTIESTKRPY